MSDRLFIGIFSTGISYADRTQEEDGDYKRLAFLSFRTLELDIYGKPDAAILAVIQTDAATYQARRGEQVEVSQCGQTVTLGGGN